MALLSAVIETAIYGGPARGFCIFLLLGWASIFAMAIVPTVARVLKGSR